jgi:hypothetical protein
MNTLIIILKKISRLIYFLVPIEFHPLHKNEKIRKLSFIYQKYLHDELNDCYDHFKKYFKHSMLFFDVKRIQDYAIKLAIDNDKEDNNFYLEFGVHTGESANFFSKKIKKLYGFDSFEGLREDWYGTEKYKGVFNLNKKIPSLENNVIPVVGWVQDTLNDFLKTHNPKIIFLHLDFDTYPSTKYTLEKIKPYLDKNAVIIFDDMFNFAGWKEGEYKALNEVFNETEYDFKAFNFSGKQVVIQKK